MLDHSIVYRITTIRRAVLLARAIGARAGAQAHARRSRDHATLTVHLDDPTIDAFIAMLLVVRDVDVAASVLRQPLRLSNPGQPGRVLFRTAERHDATLDLDDEGLLTMARLGDERAYAALFARHRTTARNLAAHLADRDDSEDIVASCFGSVFASIRSGGGPDRSFRAYLLMSIRHEASAVGQARQRLVVSNTLTAAEECAPVDVEHIGRFERETIRAAYLALPARWRAALRLVDVDGLMLSQVSTQMGISPNAVSALVYRARAGLRDSYLEQHVGTNRGADPTCRAVRTMLPGLIRRDLSKGRDEAHAHLSSCEACSLVRDELMEANELIGSRPR